MVPPFAGPEFVRGLNDFIIGLRPGGFFGRFEGNTTATLLKLGARPLGLFSGQMRIDAPFDADAQINPAVEAAFTPRSG